MSTATILCPHCQKSISIDEALSHQLTQKIEKEYQDQLKAKDQALVELETKTKEKLAQELAAEKKTLNDAFEQQLIAERKKAVNDAQTQAAQASAQELTFLKDQLTSSQKKLDESRQAELDLRKQKIALEDEKKSFELEKQRQLDEERTKIKAEADKAAAQNNELKLLELQKQLSDAVKANDDMRRKLQQGSQQTQGEVLELELEQLLKTEFPLDEIQPVAKGVRGADVLQVVKDKTGRSCGTILWELKNAQWSEKWIDKLREDQRSSKADLAVLVSINLPETIKTFSYHKGVWVTSRPLCAALAQALRFQLYQVYTTKLSAVGKNEKMDILYNYLTGLEFKHRVEAIVESFSALQLDLEKEKRWFNSKWAKQEKSLRAVMDHTLGMHGDLQGIVGAALPEIKQLSADLDQEAS